MEESASAMAQTIEREHDMMGFPCCCASGLEGARRSLISRSDWKLCYV
jgi:hypothetical protein